MNEADLLLARMDSDTDKQRLTTMLIYADWLEERGDPMAAAWRWLSEEKKCPCRSSDFRSEWFWGCFVGPYPFVIRDEVTFAALKPLHYESTMKLRAYYPTISTALADWARAITVAGGVAVS